MSKHELNVYNYLILIIFILIKVFAIYFKIRLHNHLKMMQVGL